MMAMSRMCGLWLMVACLAGTAGAQKGSEKDKPKEAGSGQIIMNMIEIKGKVDQPQAVYIINLAKPEFKGIKLEKDFIQYVKDEDFKVLGNFKVDQSLPPENLEPKKEQ
jgi:hypothetical protein